MINDLSHRALCVTLCAAVGACPRVHERAPDQQTSSQPERYSLPRGTGVAGIVRINGTPVRHFGITLTDNFAYQYYTQATEVWTRTGRFVVGDVSPGTYDLIVAGRGFSRRIIAGIRIQSGQITDLKTIDVVRGKTIDGLVTDELGQPVVDVEVTIDRTVDLAREHASLDVLSQLAVGSYTSRTDAAGHYRIDDVEQHPMLGRLHVFSVSDGRATGPHPIPTQGARVDLVLLPTGIISGQLHRKLHSEPEVIVARSMANQEIVFYATTDELGAFSLNDVPQGDYLVAIMGGPVPAQRITVAAGRHVSVTFQMP